MSYFGQVNTSIASEFVICHVKRFLFEKQKKVCFANAGAKIN